jgi:hypothetical protein
MIMGAPGGGQAIWIMGAGRFGRRAVRTLAQRCPAAALTVVDRRAPALARIDAPGLERVRLEVTDFLEQRLIADIPPPWIVPAVPFHLAVAWLRRRLSISVLPVPADICARLPNPMRGAEGELYISNADFRCPANCPEPEGVCTHTGMPRPRILYHYLSALHREELPSLVLRSHQLAPGVGGYQSHALLRLQQELTLWRNRVLLVSTACACHGVMHAMRVD